MSSADMSSYKKLEAATHIEKLARHNAGRQQIRDMPSQGRGSFSALPRLRDNPQARFLADDPKRETRVLVRHNQACWLGTRIRERLGKPAPARHSRERQIVLAK